MAQQTAGAPRKDKGKLQRRIRPRFQQLGEQKLRLAWIPQQITGRLWTTRARTRERKLHIDDGPVAANERREVRHWERDCVIGFAGGAVPLTMVGRNSRLSRIRLATKLNSDEVADATIDARRGRHTRSVTTNRGQEFGCDDALKRRLGGQIYLCDPSSP